VSVVAWSVAVWSGFTALCGTAGSFWQLFAARMGVGIGEAGGVAPSYALIADYFTPQRRARALAIFSLGIPIGSAIGLFFGGWIATVLDWRWAFVLIGLAGIPVAIALLPASSPSRRSARTTTARGRAGLSRSDGAAADQAELLAAVVRRRAASICGYGLGFWLPSYFTTSSAFRSTSSAIISDDRAGRRLARDHGSAAGSATSSAARARAPMRWSRASPSCSPRRSIRRHQPHSLGIGLVLYTLPYMLSLAWLGPVVNAVQNLVPPAMRATASASLLLINNLIGIGFGTFIFGFLSDQLKPEYGSDSLRIALLVGIGFYCAGLLMLGAAALLKRDWYRG
jgi:MFS family permease